MSLDVHLGFFLVVPPLHFTLNIHRTVWVGRDLQSDATNRDIFKSITPFLTTFCSISFFFFYTVKTEFVSSMKKAHKLFY